MSTLGAEATLGDAVDLGLQRSLNSALVSRSQALPVDLKNSWLAAQPHLEASYIESAEDQGIDEALLSLQMPIKTSAQRKADERLISLYPEAADNLHRLRRLEMSGRVRELAWSHRIAALTLERAEARLQTMTSLAAKSRQLAESGAASPYQSMVLEQAAIDSRIAVTRARNQVAGALTRFTALTGLAEVPEPMEVSTGFEQPSFVTHPLLRDLDIAYAMEMATAIATDQNRTNWNLALLARRFDGPEDNEDQYGLEVQIPISFLGSRNVSKEANSVQIRRRYQLQRDQTLIQLRDTWLGLDRERSELQEEAHLLHQSEEAYSRMEALLTQLSSTSEIESELLFNRLLEIEERRTRLLLLPALLGRNSARLNQAAGEPL